MALLSDPNSSTYPLALRKLHLRLLRSMQAVEGHKEKLKERARWNDRWPSESFYPGHYGSFNHPLLILTIVQCMGTELYKMHLPCSFNWLEVLDKTLHSLQIDKFGVINALLGDKASIPISPLVRKRRVSRMRKEKSWTDLNWHKAMQICHHYMLAITLSDISATLKIHSETSVGTGMHFAMSGGFSCSGLM